MYKDTIIESIKAFIITCDFLRDGKVNVDYLGTKATEYSIEPLSGDPILRRYTDGSKLKQFKFAFTSREYFDDSERVNIENSGFYERFEDWLEQQSLAGELPILEGRKLKPQYIKALSSGYLFYADADTARYQIECSFVYLQEV